MRMFDFVGKMSISSDGATTRFGMLRENGTPVLSTTMRDKVCLVTGANSGIGLWTAIELARQGAKVILHARSRERGEAALITARTLSGSQAIDLILADLSSPAEIRKLAEQILHQYNRLDVLINNAAIIPPERTYTSDGIEMQFAVNYLAYFLLTNLLLDRLKASGTARIINVSSSEHRNGRISAEDWQGASADYGWLGWSWYGATKLYDVLFTYELARRLEGTAITANTLHPGLIDTNLSRSVPKVFRLMYKLIMKKPATGAETSVYLASSDEVGGVTGKYFVNKREATTSPVSHDKVLARQLWDYSAQLVGL